MDQQNSTSNVSHENIEDHWKPYLPVKIFHCPLCGRECRESTHGEMRNISCTNPNCLGCTTGWGPESIIESKWEHWYDVIQTLIHD